MITLDEHKALRFTLRAKKKKQAWQRHHLGEQLYLKLLEEQKGVCLFCKRAPTPLDKSSDLALDHNHLCCPGNTSCGKCIRGLLCGSCNAKLGTIEWSIDSGFLDIAFRYLVDADYELQRIRNLENTEDADNEARSTPSIQEAG